MSSYLTGAWIKGLFGRAFLPLNWSYIITNTGARVWKSLLK